MADQLTGRALDEACEVAMGWKSDTRRWSHQSGGHVVSVSFRDDRPSCEEMTAWLIARGAELEIVYENGHWVATETRPITEEMSSPWSPTLRQALARLVVAVAAAKGGK